MAQEPIQDQVYRASTDDPETFWSRQAENLYWHKKPTKAFQRTTKHLEKLNVSHDHWSWYADGEISTTYNCVDRHVLNGNGGCVAIRWDSPVTQQKETYTYKQLLGEVETLAGVLREEGVKIGDVVLIYMPMIPAALFAMLAIARLGAVHAVVFGGFSPAALAQRIEASRPTAIMTASCGIEGAKRPTGYKAMIEEAVQKSSHKPAKTVIWQRDQLRYVISIHASYVRYILTLCIQFQMGSYYEGRRTTQLATTGQECAKQRTEGRRRTSKEWRWSLYYLHLWHYRFTQGRRSFGGRSCCRPELFHEVPLRRSWAWRCTVHGLGYRMGCRPLVYW